MSPSSSLLPEIVLEPTPSWSYPAHKTPQLPIADPTRTTVLRQASRSCHGDITASRASRGPCHPLTLPLTRSTPSSLVLYAFTRAFPLPRMPSPHRASAFIPVKLLLCDHPCTAGPRHLTCASVRCLDMLTWRGQCPLWRDAFPYLCPGGQPRPRDRRESSGANWVDLRQTQVGVPAQQLPPVWPQFPRL